jgi:UDP:flavonoid glycosyltransferase YjiC (YdhE family)
LVIKRSRLSRFSLAESRCWWPIEGVQLVLSTGKNVDINALRPLPANAIVAPSLPQVELLSRASIRITRAGINTVLEAFSAGVPLVAIPVGFDQPGIAARITYHRAGECLPAAILTTEELSAAIRNVLSNQTFAAMHNASRTRLQEPMAWNSNRSGRKVPRGCRGLKAIP